MFIENKDAERALWEQAAVKLEQANEVGAATARMQVPEDTGDLKSTIKAQKAVETETDIVCGMVAGGVAASGRIVDYSYDVEIRTPYLRAGINPFQRVFFGVSS